MINLLVRNGADINALDEGGCTPLHRAAEQGRVKSIAALLKNGANVYALTPNRWNSLHFAAFAGHISACRLLSQVDAERGILANQRDARRCTPNDVADDEETRRSLKTIWEVSERSERALSKKRIRATTKKTLFSILWLARLPPDPLKMRTISLRSAQAAEDNDLDNLLKAITLGGKEGMAKSWLPAGLEDKTSPSGLRVLHSCIFGHDIRMSKLKIGWRKTRVGLNQEKNSIDKTVQTICLLLDKNAYVNSYDGVCRTPLHLAAAFGMIPLIDVLLSRGADIEAKDVMGSTPLHYAYSFGMMKTVFALKSHGSQENVRNFITLRKRTRNAEEAAQGEGEEEGEEEESEEESEDDYDSDESGSKRRRRRRRRRGGGKGRLPRECAGFKVAIYPKI